MQKPILLHSLVIITSVVIKLENEKNFHDTRKILLICPGEREWQKIYGNLQILLSYLTSQLLEQLLNVWIISVSNFKWDHNDKLVSVIEIRAFLWLLITSRVMQMSYLNYNNFSTQTILALTLSILPWVAKDFYLFFDVCILTPKRKIWPIRYIFKH